MLFICKAKKQGYGASPRPGKVRSRFMTHSEIFISKEINSLFKIMACICFLSVVDIELNSQL